MGTFSADWLALREPADHASINAQVRQHLRAHFAGRSSVQVVDLGCGTGSNLRSLASDLPPEQVWTLVDADAQVLQIAHAHSQEFDTCAGRVLIETKLADLSQGDIADLICEADLVSASAFFDLVSPAIIERMAAQIAGAGCVFATTLTYDGIAAWLPQHSLDAALRDAFNVHQHSDKGFGAAAGPDATGALVAAFEHHGYQVVRGASPWVLTSRFAELRRQTDDGWAQAVAETGQISQDDLEEWLAFRNRQNSAVTIVGHEDVLALPPE